MADHDAAGEMSRSASDEALLALILEAFAVARRAGKEDWHLMYAGPLKNRILLLCGGKLSEPEWESTPFTKLLQRFPETLAVDFGQALPVVELLSQGRVESSAASPEVGTVERPGDAPAAIPGGNEVRRWRLRSDLWDAVMGIHASDVFLWKDGAVSRVPPEEADNDADALPLPTLTGPELDAWQKDFAAELAADDRYASVVESWGRGASPTSALPRHLQHLWYGRLKTLVRARIEEWFGQNGITLPHDVVQKPTDPLRASRSGSTPLRVFVERCIGVMTEEELAELRFPAAVPMRLPR
ncbi:MAG: hypothetical protein M3Y17_03985 [Actinomycetota bacterium]|nr:hypothetical protein [Actinomycetota bacterium]